MDKRILVVDDQIHLSCVIKSLLDSELSYEVHIAHSGAEALSKMVVQPFDIVITDLQMPGMDGLELMERIRTNYPHTRLLLMTADRRPQVDQAVSRLGVCGKLSKPFSEKDLLNMVETALA